MFGVGNLDNSGLFEAIRAEKEKKMNDGSDYLLTNEDKKPVTLADIPKEQLAQLLAEMKEELKREMKSEAEKEAEADRLRKEQLKKERQSYVQKMKESDEPWMDIEAWDEDNTGAKIELDWNDAFIKHLRDNDIVGADDDQVIQKWLILLMQDMTGKMVEETDEGEFE